ncbi:MAG: gliding motility-associated C-terminal domain-containing protein [Bacteroidetes bacterium]|nr:gliding motility-associated C-terminal domain-containing protein [Bacteroidota bacterium]
MKKQIVQTVFLALFCLIFTNIRAALINSNVVTGNWSSTSSWVGGVVPTVNDTVVIVANSVITVDNNTCTAYKARINNLGTLNCSSNTLRLGGGSVTITVLGTPYTYIGNGSLTINTGGIFNLNTGTLKLTGNFITNGTFNCGTGTVVFDTKNAVIGISGTKAPTFYNLVNSDSVRSYYPIAGGFGVTLHSNNTTIKGNVVIDGSFNRNTSATNDTAKVTFDGNTTLSGMYSFYLNNVVINIGATLNAANKNFNLYGNWTSNGTFVCGTGTIYFLRDTYNQLVQNIYQANPDLNPFYNLEINKTSGSVTQIAGTLNLNGNIYVNNNFTVNKGTYDMGGVHRLYVGKNFTVNSANSAVYIASTGRLLLNGTSATPQQINTGGSNLYKFTIDNIGGGVVQASDINVTFEFVLSNGVLNTKNGATLYEMYLSNSDPLSLPTYSSTSFLVGKLKRELIAGAANYTFPVGVMNTTPLKYRPIVYQQTSSGTATNIYITEDTISNNGTYKSNFWARIQENMGAPVGSFNFAYNLSTDFPVGTIECAIQTQRGSVPSPANWNYILNTTTAASGGNSGSIVSTIPATMAPNAFVLGEVSPIVAGTTICSGNTTALMVTSPSNFGFFNWYDAPTGGNLVLGNNGSFTSPVLNNTTTYYVEHNNSLNGCGSHRTPVTVIVNPTPIVTVNNPTICNGSSINLTANGANTYVWSNSLTLNPISVSPSTNSVYTVTGTSNGCVGTAVSNVTVNPIPVITVNSPTICESTLTNLTANGGSSYQWSNGSTDNPISVSPNITTSYSVTGTSLGCSATVISTVNVNPNPIITVNNPTICAASTTSLTANGANSYLWSNGSTTNPITVSPGVNITYTVTGTSLGCTGTATSTVTISSNLLINIVPSAATICNGSTTNLNASGGDNYLWSSGSSTNPLVVSPSITTSYSVTGTDASGCSGTTITTITVNPIPILTVNNPTICSGDSSIISANGANSYIWSNGSTLNSFSISPIVTTTYTVTGTSIGCSSTATSLVTINPNPSISVNNATICEGSFANISAIGASSYLWSNSMTNNSISVSPGATASYTVTGTSNGCSSTAISEVIVNQLPIITLENDHSGLTIFDGQIVTFTATPSGYDNYTFYINSVLVQSGNSNIYITNSLISGDTLSVIVSNGDCESLNNSEILQIAPTPNAFTPDNDGVNDLFMKGVELQIINRWGQELYTGKDGWDGKFNGEEVSPGTYYFIITKYDLNNVSKKEKGSVLLIK